MFLFRKHLRKESVFETKEKLFQFLKRFFLFFCKKMPEAKNFRVARMVHHTTLTFLWQITWFRKNRHGNCSAGKNCL